MGSTPKDNEKSIAAEPNSTVVPEQSASKDEAGSQAKPVDWEKRYKDTQKNIQERSIENKQLQAKNDALAKQLSELTTTPVEIPEEVEELKFSNPDEWRKKVNKLEQEAKLKDASERQEILDKASKDARDEFELDRRKRVFTEFQAANPGLEINDQVLASDIPPSISNKLADGTSTFEEFLEEVKTYLSTGHKVSKEPTMNEPNLGSVAGGEQPSIEAQRGDSKASYANEIY